MNLFAILINSVAVLTTFGLMTVVLLRSLKRTRKMVRIEQQQTEEQRKAEEIARWLAAIKHETNGR